MCHHPQETWQSSAELCWATATLDRLKSLSRSTSKRTHPILQDLLERLFHFRPRVTAVRYGSTVDLYMTSAYFVRELRRIGLYSSNKVRDQVGIPDWIFSAPEHQKRFLRGFFDTDGSIYRLKHFNAVQMSFSNLSVPLLEGTRQLLLGLAYHPSRVSGHSVYLTRREDIKTHSGNRFWKCETRGKSTKVWCAQVGNPFGRN